MPKPRFDFFIRRPAVVRSIDHAAALGLPVLGSISEFDPKPGARLPDARFPEALEAYRRLADVVRAPHFHVRGHAIVVTGAEAGTGKSTIAKNLATLLARGGSKVILVEADTNRVVARRLGDGISCSGFAGLLVNQLMRPSDALVHTMDPRLKLLPAGSVNGSPAALLQSSRLSIVVDALRELSDHVIFDAATASDDVVNLTRLADVTLLVLRSGTTRRKRASDAARTLREANRGLFGFVLNRAPVVTSAPESEPGTSPVEEAAEMPGAAEPRLEIAVDDLLADLEGALSLIRDIRVAGRSEDKEDDAELVTMDRTDR